MPEDDSQESRKGPVRPRSRSRAGDNPKAAAKTHRPVNPVDPRRNPALNPGINPRVNPRAPETISLHASLEPGHKGARLAPVPAFVPEPLRLPPVSEVRLLHTSRLLPAKYSQSVLTRIADDDADLQQIFALDHATNDRLLAEGNLRLGITARELVFDAPCSRIINAAFTHPHPQGARFSMPYRGAWYAGVELATAKAEVLFHRAVQFAEIGWQQPEELDYDQYTADFCGSFHDLRPPTPARPGLPGSSQLPPVLPLPPGAEPGRRPPLVIATGIASGDRRARSGRQDGAELDFWDLNIQAAQEDPRNSLEDAPPTAAEFAHCLAPDSYIASQQLAIDLLEAGSPGIIYPSARRPGGNCIACFRPSLVANVRKRDLYRLRWYPDRAATFVRSPRAVPPPDTPAPSPAS